MKQLTELNTWIALENHAQKLRILPFNDLKRNLKSLSYVIQTDNIEIDFSHQKINETTIDLLIALANERNLKENISALSQGEKVNVSEQRAALHTALRIFDEESILVDCRNVVPDVLATRAKMGAIATQVRKGEWLGYSGSAITDVVNIGIGGSDFGPRFCLHALSDYVHPELNFHFVSDCDPHAFERTVKKLKPETTLFIISSKSFTTKETLYNAKKAIAWINQPTYINKHFIAVTANIEKAKNAGFQNVLSIWDWVGGRYSLCSAINLITCIAIGYEQFMELLAGANRMDKHFQANDFYENLPVLLGLIGIWNINFLRTPSHLLLVYAKELEQFVPFIQQLDMESNGKSIDNQGNAINYATGPIVWGGSGNQAQHSYYQLLCQGTHKIATDIISIKKNSDEMINDFCNATLQVLSNGVPSESDPYSYIAGGCSINHLSLTSCTPSALGALVALYEHKIFVQSVIWNINSFDQPGVESAKRFKPVTDKKISLVG